MTTDANLTKYYQFNMTKKFKTSDAFITPTHPPPRSPQSSALNDNPHLSPSPSPSPTPSPSPLTLQVGISWVVAAILMLTRHEIGKVFSNSQPVITMIAQITPLVAGAYAVVAFFYSSMTVLGGQVLGLGLE